jgi:hypothetical protein
LQALLELLVTLVPKETRVRLALRVTLVPLVTLVQLETQPLRLLLLMVSSETKRRGLLLWSEHLVCRETLEYREILAYRAILEFRETRALLVRMAMMRCGISLVLTILALSIPQVTLSLMTVRLGIV